MEPTIVLPDSSRPTVKDGEAPSSTKEAVPTDGEASQGGVHPKKPVVDNSTRKVGFCFLGVGLTVVC